MNRRSAQTPDGELRVGFIIDGNLPAPGEIFLKRMSPHRLFTGWPSASPMGQMRFNAIAQCLAARGSARYELYRPFGRSYDAVIFLKSMNEACLALAQRLKAGGTTVIFDANVDYYSNAPGEGYYAGMAPTERQRAQAIAMTTLADGVMASSRHLTAVCSQYNARCQWVPDNVENVPALQPQPRYSEPLDLWWSGEPVKLFELLLIEEVLLKLRPRIHLHLVTNSLSALERWRGDFKARFLRLLEALPHTVHGFESVADLQQKYTAGGLIISPRFLDHPYNLGHSEWKLTLGMACGLPALGSPVPSYLDVAERAAPGAIRVCETLEDWESGLRQCLSGDWSWAEARAAARRVVQEHYSTPVVSGLHLEFVRKCLADTPDV